MGNPNAYRGGAESYNPKNDPQLAYLKDINKDNTSKEKLIGHMTNQTSMTTENAIGPFSVFRDFQKLVNPNFPNPHPLATKISNFFKNL